MTPTQANQAINNFLLISATTSTATSHPEGMLAVQQYNQRILSIATQPSSRSKNIISIYSRHCGADSPRIKIAQVVAIVATASLFLFLFAFCRWMRNFYFNFLTVCMQCKHFVTRECENSLHTTLHVIMTKVLALRIQNLIFGFCLHRALKSSQQYTTATIAVLQGPLSL